MSLTCKELSDLQCISIGEVISGLDEGHILRKQYNAGLTIFRCDDAVVFTSSDKTGRAFWFRRGGDLLEVIYDEIRLTREYICGAFELMNSDKGAAKGLYDRFVETHGMKMAAQIDHIVIHFEEKTLMLAKFPSSVIRHMLAPQGGRLCTKISGPADMLRTIPTLAKFVQLPNDDGHHATMIVTEYTRGQLELARLLHYDIVREIVSRPHVGICVGPIAVWDG